MDRDRDASGRALNARPRDELGRPLPYGTPGTERAPEGVIRTPDETITDAQEALDAGRPFHAHEIFEDAWKQARGEALESLWKALAQLAVAETHRLRGNAVGAERLRARAAVALREYAESPRLGLDVGGLTAWAEQPTGRPMPPLRAASAT